MIIKIKDTEAEVRQTFRAHIIYEQITGQTFSPKNVTDVITFFYSTVMACNPDLTLDFNEFIDWLDESPDTLAEFVKFLTDGDKRQQAMAPQTADKATAPKQTAKKRSDGVVEVVGV